MDVNLFETTIRVLGGLLSVHGLTHTGAGGKQDAPGDELWLKLAVDLGDRLMPAFAKSSSAVPFSDVNLGTHNAHSPSWGSDSSLAEVTTLQMEFKYLSHVTGNPAYHTAVDRTMDRVDEQIKRAHGLASIFVSPTDGSLRPGRITLGARGDSYYEYLLKQWLLTGKKEDKYVDMCSVDARCVDARCVDARCVDARCVDAQWTTGGHCETRVARRYAGLAVVHSLPH